MVAALLEGHRPDDCLGLDQFFLIGFRCILELPELVDSGDHIHDLFQGTHFLDLLNLLKKIFQGKRIFLDLPRKSLRAFLINDGLGPLNQRKHIAHAENAGGSPVRMKNLQCLDRFPNTDKFNRFAGDFLHREGSAPAGITLHFSQDDTGDLKTVIECTSNGHRILTGHGISHKQHLTQGDCSTDLLELGHKSLIHMQSASGIDNDGLVRFRNSLGDGKARDICWFLPGV